MPFEPKNERHAIQEVVFVLTFSRNFSAQEIEDTIKRHDEWRAELPGIVRQQVLQFAVGDARPPSPPPTLVAGVDFTAHKRDGSLDWRVRLDDNLIAVNCLTYIRWAEVWPRARELLKIVTKNLAQGDNSVNSIGLQYIDVFLWKGEEAKYQIDLLLRRDSPHVPETLWDKGPLWHLHLGWFRKDDLPADGRLLERVHLDGLLQDGQHLVRMDSTLRLDIKNPIDNHDVLFKDDGMIDRVFSDLHSANKQLLLSYITPDIAKRIELNG